MIWRNFLVKDRFDNDYHICIRLMIILPLSNFYEIMMDLKCPTVRRNILTTMWSHFCVLLYNKTYLLFFFQDLLFPEPSSIPLPIVIREDLSLSGPYGRNIGNADVFLGDDSCPSLSTSS